MVLKEHTIYESNIDCRTIICACGEPNCKIGLSFDSEPSIVMLTDKFGNDHAMHLNKKNAKQIMKSIKAYL